MKHNNISPTILTLILALMVAGCEKEIAYHGGTLKNFMVLNATLNANQEAECIITRSNTILESSQPIGIKDAKVSLQVNNAWFPFKYSNDEGKYRIEGLEIKEGEKYEIKVEHPAFPNLSAIATIPSKPKAELISLKPANPLSEYSNKLEAKVKIYDSKETDFYQLKIYHRINPTYKNIIEIESSDAVLNGNKVVTNSEFEDQPENRYKVFNDDLFNGKEYTLTFTFYFYDNDESLPELNIELSKISEDLFLYYKTLDAAQFYLDNPFSEPVRLHTNIKGGAGIVGAKSTTNLTIDKYKP